MPRNTQPSGLNCAGSCRCVAIVGAQIAAAQRHARARVDVAESVGLRGQAGSGTEWRGPVPDRGPASSGKGTASGVV
ncbi:hypothetical protein BN2476_630088 [Paraburkholderia piptadeniae]|uniref:Uncharacterized protein n=1 Tax=Paraburkholderia piptadeniae TaxID=1701573 RepID=A0A1N7SLK6_9BURK|nr:hypothetical protein BN2476_630088 [Paraburkholderia piptadeniae]